MFDYTMKKGEMFDKQTTTSGPVLDYYTTLGCTLDLKTLCWSKTATRWH